MTNPSQSSAATPTLFLRLEGPLQSWGGRTIGRYRRTEPVPTKSGVIGLLGAALGLSRLRLNDRLDELNGLEMAVRVDRAGDVLEDYQTVGAGIGVLSADGKIKKTAGTGEFEAIISPREYLIDASFLVILRGHDKQINGLAGALQDPQWPLFLGRKRCVPGTRVFAGTLDGATLAEALDRDGPDDDSLLAPDKSASVRVITDLIDALTFGTLIEGDGEELNARYEAAKSYVTDRLVRLDPPVHGGRIMLNFEMRRPDPKQSKLDRPILADSLFGEAGPDRKQRANDPETKKVARAKSGGRCIFCRFEPSDPTRLHAHHLTYERRGREFVKDDWESTETDDFVMLCEECHAAVTMLEYQNGFGLKRVDPRRPEWRDRILGVREARRRFADPDRPTMEAGARPRTDIAGDPPDLIETIIPLKAGSSFAPDAPGNRWLTNRHHVHQRLSMAFPEPGGRFAADGYGVTRDEGGFLFRVEPGPVARIIVRSRILPDWGRAFAKAGWLVPSTLPRPRQFDLAAYSEGTEWEFAVEANPVKRLRADGPEGRKGARVPMRDDDSLTNWIGYRAEAGGFEILELGIERLGRRTAQMRSAANRHWEAVAFSGRLRVTDSPQFHTALIRGIGPAKAYGFGLLRLDGR